MRALIWIVFTFLIIIPSLSQSKKQMVALRVSETIIIDGILDDDGWKNALPATDFIERAPKPGEPAPQKTEVKIVYDDIAIYVAATMYDNHPDSLVCELCQRDNESNVDLIGLIIDTYKDNINGYGFFVTSAGVQVDTRYSSNGQDNSWNAVWQSKIKITDKGWTAEFKIPYSAIRFPKVKEQNWGLNFMRKTRKTKGIDYWNEVKPEVNGILNQCGDLKGISEIKSPVRLSLSPYVSMYLENYPYNKPGQSNNSYSLNGGMDIKYGINESFTLDMTLVPDFGQVQSDNQVLNLSPFEVQFNENRQFFTEGTELFNKAGLVYWRRIGGIPMNFNVPLKNNETLKSNPSSSQLINATKLSGRTNKNLGIGLFNATTANTYAVIADSNGRENKLLTQPQTNYNIIVFDQALKNNSYISFINTNVTRKGNYRDANVTATVFKFANKKNRYGLYGNTAVSQIFNLGNTKPVSGYSYDVTAGKISGKFQYNVRYNLMSDQFSSNDFGILYINNYRQASLNFNYNIYKPFWKLIELYLVGKVTSARLYKPNLLWTNSIYGSSFATFKKSYLSFGSSFNLSPFTSLDHWESRVAGRYYVFPKHYLYSFWISSDYRKLFALDANISYRYFDENKRYNFSFGASPRLRISNRLMIIYNFQRNYSNDDIGFAGYNDTNLVVHFGRRNVVTLTNQLNVNYIFTNRMSLSLRGRHYWSQAKYKQYYILNTQGYLQNDEQYAGTSDLNYNTFNVDLVYIWQFSPGSEISFVWKNSIYTSGSAILNHYGMDLKETLTSPQTNGFSVKILYYLDYSTLVKRKKKNGV